MSTVPPQDRGEGCHTDNWTWPGRREGSLQLAWAARQEGVRALTWVFLAQPPPLATLGQKSADWGQGGSHGQMQGLR